MLPLPRALQSNGTTFPGGETNSTVDKEPPAQLTATQQAVLTEWHTLLKRMTFELENFIQGLDRPEFTDPNAQYVGLSSKANVPHMLRKQSGVLEVSSYFLQELPNNLFPDESFELRLDKLLKELDFYTVECRHSLHRFGYELFGVSSYFDIVEEGESSPTYEIICSGDPSNIGSYHVKRNHD